ncbi:MAG: SMC-Scp complex subunit ScpB [Verrucomicrobiales bacterium]
MPPLSRIVEALLFASPEPLTTSTLVRAIRAAAKPEVPDASDVSDPSEASEASDTSDPSEASEVPPDTAPSPAVLARVSDAQVLDALAELAASYAAEGRAFTLAERATGWRIFTRAEYGPWVRGLFPDRRPHRLSQPALETLAIIAYRQPITKAAVEAVRGVSIDGPLQKLLEQNIIRIAGRADLPGRPLLYETTDLFFEHFGIRSIDDLPNASELRRVALPVAENEKPTEPDAVQPELPIGESTEPPAAAEEPSEPESAPFPT